MKKKLFSLFMATAALLGSINICFPMYAETAMQVDYFKGKLIEGIYEGYD